MTRKHKTIRIYCVLLLLAAAIIASGRYINSKTAPSPEEVRAEKLAELKADLLKAAESGPAENKSANTRRSPARESTRSGST